MLETEWKYADLPEPEKVKSLCESLGVKEDVVQLLINRGISDFDEAKTFFRPSFEDLHDPFLMKGMDKAVSRLEEALGNGEKLLIYGDYDVDGTTSVALVYSFLKDLGQVDFYIPDRYKTLVSSLHLIAGFALLIKWLTPMSRELISLSAITTCQA